MLTAALLVSLSSVVVVAEPWLRIESISAGGMFMRYFLSALSNCAGPLCPLKLGFATRSTLKTPRFWMFGDGAAATRAARRPRKRKALIKDCILASVERENEEE